MKYLAIILCCVAAVSCGPKVPPPPTYQAQTPVPRAPAVSPHVEGLREATAQADRASAVREDRGKRMVTEAQRLREGLRLVVVEARRLREKEVATEEEIQELWVMLEGQQQIAEALYVEADRYRQASQTEATARQLANSKLPPLQKAVEEARTELEQVRLQLEDAELTARNASAAAHAHHQAAAGLQSKLDEEKGAKKTWRWIALVAAGIALISVLIIVFRPRLF